MAGLLLRMTFPPWQNVVGPPGVITGVGGGALTVTATGAETGEVQPLASTIVTEKLPEAFTVIAGVVAPFDHR